MLYARINTSTNEVLEFPLQERELRDRLANTTLPEKITDFSLAGTNYVCVPPLSEGVPYVATETHQIASSGAHYDAETGTFVREYRLEEVPEAKRPARNLFRFRSLQARRKKVFDTLDAKILRYQSEVRQGLTPTDDIAELDAKAQALRDITLENVWNISDDIFEV